MSSISLMSGMQQSPLAMLQKELTSEVSAGTISSSDQSALSTALNTIDSDLQNDASSSSGRPSPAQLQSTIKDLISQQVQSGALTSNQATELQNIFSNTFANGPGGAGGMAVRRPEAAASAAQAAPTRPALRAAPRSSSCCWPPQTAARTARTRPAAPRRTRARRPTQAPRRAQAAHRRARRTAMCSISFCSCSSNRSATRRPTIRAARPTIRSRH